jgi:protein-L-isoaspartate(D-aspartate) O-methyltransferase
MKSLNEHHLAILRRHMVEVVAIEYDLMGEEIGHDQLSDPVYAAMLRVPRHLFVPTALAAMAYQDTPLPIGFDKTISQPFIGALMLDLLDIEPGADVLEVGTGLGYQAAMMAEIGARVWTVEIVEEFAHDAGLRLQQLGYAEVTLRVGDGSRGWADHAPFDRILVTAASHKIPQALVDQLKPGGRLVMPIGNKESQQLTVLEKGVDGRIGTREVMAVRFTELETVM